MFEGLASKGGDCRLKKKNGGCESQVGGVLGWLSKKNNSGAHSRVATLIQPSFQNKN